MERELPSCERILDLHPEFSDLVRSRCPRCQGQGSTCAIEYLRALAGEAETVGVAREMSPPAQSADRKFPGE